MQPGGLRSPVMLKLMQAHGGRVGFSLGLAILTEIYMICISVCVRVQKKNMYTYIYICVHICIYVL